MPRNTRQLHLTGRLLLWSMRHWIRARRQNHDLPNFVRYTLAQLPVGNTVCCFLEGALAHLTLGARRPLRTAAPDSPRLTSDEAAVLDALLALRFRLDTEARWCLADLQHGAALRSTVASLAILARLLERHALRLSVADDALGMFSTSEPRATLDRPLRLTPNAAIRKD